MQRVRVRVTYSLEAGLNTAFAAARPSREVNYQEFEVLQLKDDGCWYARSSSGAFNIHVLPPHADIQGNVEECDGKWVRYALAVGEAWSGTTKVEDIGTAERLADLAAAALLTTVARLTEANEAAKLGNIDHPWMGLAEQA